MKDVYVYPGTSILKNKLGIRDSEALEFAETAFFAQRMREGAPLGDFDLVHLQGIHRHLFQDIYEWAGEIRTVEISKGSTQFMFRQYIPNGMEDVHRRLRQSNYLRKLSATSFAIAAGQIIGDVNHVHPFREGNGRSQLVYLKQLAERAGHPLDLQRLDTQQWITASQEAHYGRYDAMATAILGSIRDRARDRGVRDETRGR